jgi:hypothetical protein
MKTTFNKTKWFNYFIVGALAVLSLQCKKEEELPPEENEEEVITDVKLIFTNALDNNDVVEATAQDPDGEGVQPLAIINEINLDADKTYNLTFDIKNNLESPGEDIGAEILEENDEHQIFFSFSNDAFANPIGNGNIDAPADPIVYNDSDMNGANVGLSTTWTTSANTISGGNFVVRLQHQPDVKTLTSRATDGDTDFELQFVLNIQ